MLSENSPAAKAGIKAGDILLAMDGQQIKTIQDIKIDMLDKEAGDPVKVRVRRHGLFFGEHEIESESCPVEI